MATLARMPSRWALCWVLGSVCVLSMPGVVRVGAQPALLLEEFTEEDQPRKLLEIQLESTFQPHAAYPGDLAGRVVGGP